MGKYVFYINCLITAHNIRNQAQFVPSYIENSVNLVSHICSISSCISLPNVLEALPFSAFGNSIPSIKSGFAL